jgi:uncharacterized protein
MTKVCFTSRLAASLLTALLAFAGGAVAETTAVPAGQPVQSVGQAPSRASIDRLLTLTETERTLLNMHEQIDEAMRLSVDQSLQGYSITGEERQTLDAMLDRLSGLYREELSWEKMKAISQQVYAESFTQDEINGLIAFYESPAGRAFVAKMPFVMQKSMTLMQERIGPLMHKIHGAIGETLQGMASAKEAREPEVKDPKTPGKAKVKPRPRKNVAKRSTATSKAAKK